MALSTIPLAVYASDTDSDKADWIKQHLSRASNDDALVAIPEALSSAKRHVVPYRPLPTRAELLEQRRRELEAQTARIELAAQQGQRLQGGVSENAQNGDYQFSQPYRSSYGDVSAQAAPQSAPSRQYRPATRRAQAAPVQPSAAPSFIAEPPVMPPSFMPAWLSQMPNFPQQGAAPSQAMQQAPIAAYAAQQARPFVSPENKAKLDRLLQQVTGNQMGAISEQALDEDSASGFSEPKRELSAPPFPLNMVPPQMLKQFIKSAAKPTTNGPRASFGSWREQVGPARASFRSYMSRRPAPRIAPTPPIATYGSAYAQAPVAF